MHHQSNKYVGHGRSAAAAAMQLSYSWISFQRVITVIATSTIVLLDKQDTGIATVQTGTILRCTITLSSCCANGRLIARKYNMYGDDMTRTDFVLDQ
eukprot:1922507-Amphidinium_carterae.1